MGEQFLDRVLDSWHFVRMYVFPESHRMHLSQRRQVLEVAGAPLAAATPRLKSISVTGAAHPA